MKIGFIGSLDTDKGADIILSKVPELVASDIQLVSCVNLYMDRILLSTSLTCIYVKRFFFVKIYVKLLIA